MAGIIEDNNELVDVKKPATRPSSVKVAEDMSAEKELLDSGKLTEVAAIESKIKKDTEIPPGYYEITLSSCGKLGLPAKIHVCDYKAQDAMKLASARSEDLVETLLGIASRVIWEDIDIYNIHENDLEEILLNIYNIFWSPTIEGYPFPYELEDFEVMSEDQKAKIRSGQEGLYVDLDISKITSKPLAADVNEPIVLQKNGLTVKFSIPRLANAIIVDKYIKDHFAREEEQFEYIKALLRRKELEEEEVIISKPEQIEYEAYCNKRDSLYLSLAQAMLIDEYNGKELTTIEEKLEAYNEIGLQFFMKLNEEIESKFQFGVDSELEVTSPVTNKLVKRKFQFQLVEFIPTYRLPKLDGFTVTTGNT